jgi:quinol-cytochrome oxidoreductase complex cytochrome b subunit
MLVGMVTDRLCLIVYIVTNKFFIAMVTEIAWGTIIIMCVAVAIATGIPTGWSLSPCYVYWNVGLLPWLLLIDT